MNCKRTHQQIHLFTELTREERDEVLNHISECEQCRELAESMKVMTNVLSRISIISVEPMHSSRLTNKIMSEINKSQAQSFNLFEWILTYIELGQVKLVMAGVSLVLFSLFAIEQTRSPVKANQYSSNSDFNSAILNARNFQDQLSSYKAREKSRTIKACRNLFSKSKLSVACLREKSSRFKTL
ncbi:MAG: zf-HC2 domain-containing protein [Chryseolinea sp.]